MGLRALRATCLGAVLSTAACDFTEPQWEVDLILPFNSDTIAFEDVLPPGITIGEIEGELAFIIPAIADSTSFTLGAACGSPCSTLQGQTVPVPGFAFVDTLDIALGSTLLSIEIRDGTISYMIDVQSQHRRASGQHRDKRSDCHLSLGTGPPGEH
jgi:hypothetical protein